MSTEKPLFISNFKPSRVVRASVLTIFAFKSSYMALRNIIPALTLLLCSFFSSALFGQDLIALESGDVLHGKVLVIGVDKVTYTQAQFPDGPAYEVRINDVCMIEYGTGRIEYFGKCKKQRERQQARAQRMSQAARDWSAGNRRLEFHASYSMPLGDFRNGTEYDGPQALDGYSIGLSYQRGFQFLPDWIHLRAEIQHSVYEARFDTSFAGIDVGGGSDFLNIQIARADWNTTALNLSAPLLLIGLPRIEVSVAPHIGVNYLSEARLEGSSSIFFFNTQFSNRPDSDLALQYGASFQANYAFNRAFSAGITARYSRSNHTLNSVYTFNINGTETTEENTFSYDLMRFDVGVNLIYSF